MSAKQDPAPEVAAAVLSTAPPAAPTAAPPSRWSLLELGLLILAALGSLAFYATLPSRLPTDADYEHAAAAIREGFAAGDAVANAPEWAERARELVHGLRFLEPPDLPEADLSDVRRLWLISLPSAPRSDAAQVVERLSAKLTRDGDPQRFGALSVQRFVNPAFREPLYAFTHELAHADVAIESYGQRSECQRSVDEFHCGRAATVAREIREIAFAPHECVGANAAQMGGRPELVIEYPQASLGKELDVMAAVTGEMAWKHAPQFNYTPVKLTVAVDGAQVGVIDIPPGTVPAQHLVVDTSRVAEAPTHRVRFAVSSDNPTEREFCFDARAY